MSNLGKIYKVNLIDGVQEGYPIVYKNEENYVCKIHGNHDVLIFDRHSAIRPIYTIDKFIAAMEQDIVPNITIFVFEPPHEHFNFKAYCNKTNHIIARLRSDISRDERTKEYWLNELEKFKKHIKECQENIDSIERRISDKKDAIQKLKEKNNEH